MMISVEEGVGAALCNSEPHPSHRKVVIMVEQIRPASFEDSSEGHVALQMLDEWTAERHEGLIRKSLVVDRLLDLRTEFAEEPLLKIEIDQYLAAVPGNSVVEQAWWRATTTALRTELSARVASSAGVTADS